jgi:peptidoglycan-associated lipoprotein
MIMLMRKTTISMAAMLMAAVMFAGCGSSGPVKEQDAAPVVDAQPSKPTPVITQPTLKQPATQPTPQVVPDSTIKSAEIPPRTPPAPGDPRRDANNILSKRIIYFDFDSNLVKEEYRPIVAAHAKYLAGDAKARIIIQGHTDERGGREYNIALGQRRSDAVRQMMTVLGSEAARVESVSFGKEKPAAEGTTEEAWAKNRRAEIVYQGE